MSNETLLTSFMSAVDAWVCDNYALDIRFIAESHDSGNTIWDASITLNPLPPQLNLSFCVSAAGFVFGHYLRPKVRKSELIALLERALVGEIKTPDLEAKLPSAKPLDFYSEMAYRDRWFCPLHLQILGERRQQPGNIDLAAVDNALRCSVPPFDGLTDAANWLGLSSPGAMTNPAAIGVRISPPVDLIYDECHLASNSLTVTLHAHPKFDVSRVGFAVRATPGVDLGSRKQVADKFKWERVSKGRRQGVAKIELDQADNAQMMLLIEGSTVRRQWIGDPAKARNNRLLAVQHFDKDLKMIKQAVLESSDSNKFEHGVAALLFALGFIPSVQLETAAPDLIVTTPGGKLILVECTIRISDFATKVGKLVDRRGSLSKQLSASGHSSQVSAVLICRLPRDQIAAQENELRAHSVILLTIEQLQTGFERVRFQNDPDAMIDAALARLARESARSLN